jgi:5-methylcytosine-specific restriction endonuclease McrA
MSYKSLRKKIEPKIRAFVFKRDKGKCVDCNKISEGNPGWYWTEGIHNHKEFHVGIDFEIHHTIPINKGGDNKPDNLILLCCNCHLQRENQRRRSK